MDFPQRLNLAALAQAMGVYGVRIEDPEQIGPEMKKALASGKPAVLDIVIDGTL
jgi:sulfoacetaldehyde acetyltransferase